MRRTWSLLMAVALCLLLAQPASAGVFEDMYVDFAKDGKLDACSYPASLLKKIKTAIPNDIEQYAPDFPDELDAAIATRAQGKCKGGAQERKPAVVAPVALPSSTGGGGRPAAPQVKRTPVAGAQPAPPSPPPTPTPAPRPAAPIVIATDSIPVAATVDGGGSGGGLPAPVLLLAVLGIPLALACAFFLGSRWLGYHPRWAEHLRHSVSEAGWRASSTFAEFTDFVRFGR